MHDCRKTKEDLIDLIFNEMDEAAELRLLEEMEACRACRAEYHSMREALGAFDDAAPALQPAREFWPEHHARVEERLDAAQSAHVLPFWRRTLRTSFSVPVPIAIAATLLLAATSVLAIRSFIFNSSPKNAPSEATEAKIKYVEVPVEKRVVEERVVTRTVYVTKRSRQNNQSAPSAQNLQDITAQYKDEGINATRATLNGFQPPSDVKLTVIKGSQSDEK
ncbi:MAG: hypothetical protein ICV60_16220 [Pyrinomonadaceae bacterium]|nr:hypothetical protein [Pyrinomonadaceae bacterium]